GSDPPLPGPGLRPWPDQGEARIGIRCVNVAKRPGVRQSSLFRHPILRLESLPFPRSGLLRGAQKARLGLSYPRIFADWWLEKTDEKIMEFLFASLTERLLPPPGRHAELFSFS